MCVRPSIAFYGSFSLDMGRSPGFGPAYTDFLPLFTEAFCALHTRFPYGSGIFYLNLAGIRSSPDRSTKSTRSDSRGPSTVCRHRGSGSLSLPSRGPFHLSFTVLFSIGHKGYLALRGGPRSFPQGFSCLVVLWILPRSSGFHLRGFHPLWRAFPGPFCYPLLSLVQSEPRCARTPVWALPVSLAATSGIDVSFFSSGYLDVSVHRVPSVSLSGLPLLQHTAAEVCSAGFPHSDICGSLLICSSPQLFAAYHVFLRPFVPRHPPCALLCLTSLPSGSPPSSAPSVALSGSLVLGILPAPLLLQPHLQMSFLFLSVILGSRCCLSRFTNLIDLDFQYSVFKVQTH